MALGDLTKALAILTVLLDGDVFQHQRIAADVLALGAGAPHASAYALDDQGAFQFGDDTDNHRDGSAQWSSGIDIFSEREELDLQPVQLVKGGNEMARISS